jgi:hypothetical protein
MAEYNATDEFIAARRSLSLHGVFYEKGVVIDKTRLTQGELQRLFFWGLIAPRPEPEPKPEPEPELEPA